MALLPEEFLVVPGTLRLVVVPDPWVVRLLVRDLATPVLVEAVGIVQDAEERIPTSLVESSTTGPGPVRGGGGWTSERSGSSGGFHYRPLSRRFIYFY